MFKLDLCLPTDVDGIKISAFIDRDINEILDELHPDERELLNTFISQGGLVRIQPEDPCDFGCFFVANKTPVMELYLRDNKIPTGTIVHEMVHYEQLRRGDLTYKDGKRYWKGVLRECNMVNPVAYRFSPWESEAFSIQNAWLEKNGFIKSYHAREFNQRLSAVIENWVGTSLIIAIFYLIVMSAVFSVYTTNPIASIPFALIAVSVTARLPLSIRKVMAKRKEQS